MGQVLRRAVNLLTWFVGICTFVTALLFINNLYQLDFVMAFVRFIAIVAFGVVFKMLLTLNAELRERYPSSE